MLATTVTAFAALLRRHQLLEPDQQTEVEQSLASRFPETKVLARELVQRGWLTPYQVNLLSRGQAAELRLGNYVLLERLGEGGMGQVFKARHVNLDRVVALKLIRKERLANPQAVKRFHREIQAAAALNHPHIVLAFDADQSGDTHFLTMEYVEGADLAQWVKKEGPLSNEEACNDIRQAALGLQHAFECGLVHRDIKPHNLLRAKDGTVKILDMGLAHLARPDSEDASSSSLTKEGSVMGTLDYIAPEQATDSHTVDIRADLYSLGCTFYFLLTGRVPFPGGDALAKLMKHKLEEPVSVEQLRPEVPPSVAAIVRRLMAKRPEDRYQTPAELADALDRRARESPPQREGTLVTGESRAKVVDPADTVAYVPPRNEPKRRRGLLLALGGCAVVIGMILLALRFFPDRRPSVVQSTPQVKPPESAPERSVQFTNRLGMEFVLVLKPKGKFLRGGGRGEVGTREVEIANDYYLGKYEVTQEEWQKLMPTKPSWFSRDSGGKEAVKGISDMELKRYPVENVSWDTAQSFLKALNAREKEPGWVYRLPTEAEWEYACRGGRTANELDYGSDFYFDQPSTSLRPDQANYQDSGLQRTCKVGSYTPNRLGLYDMHGNVWEWCDDHVKAANGEPHRVTRGGSWCDDSEKCRAAHRLTLMPSYHVNHRGLRVARIPVGQAKAATFTNTLGIEFVLRDLGSNRGLFQSPP